VISVGNLAVGGRGKTPIVASIARELLAMGERPAILTRGYARIRPEDGIVVVRDPDGIRGDLARAGDEPLMLARELVGVSVLVCSDRYLAGRLAEHRWRLPFTFSMTGFSTCSLIATSTSLIGRDTLPAGHAAVGPVARATDTRLLRTRFSLPMKTSAWNRSVSTRRSFVPAGRSGYLRWTASPSSHSPVSRRPRSFSTIFERSAAHSRARWHSGIITRTRERTCTGL
jgi:hypothetical protein